MHSGAMETEKQTAAEWFGHLRDEITAAFEAVEDSQDSGPGAERPAGRFERTPTRRTGTDGEDAGGGLACIMRGGRVFEKVGVNVSEVYGTLGERAQAAMAARCGTRSSPPSRGWRTATTPARCRMPPPAGSK